MRRTIYEVKCDRCGKIIDSPHEKIGYICLNERDPETDNITAFNELEECDFCPKCMEEIKRFIGIGYELTKEKITEIIEENKPEGSKPEPAQEPEPKKKIGHKERKIDVPKAQALRDAGWTISAVADELGVSEQTVKTWTVGPRQKKKAKPLEFGGSF